MSRRSRILLGLGGVAVVAAVPGLLLLGSRGGGDAASATTTPPATAKVETRDLAERLDANGTLGYGDPRPLSLGGQGTLTSLPALGAVIDRGGELAEVDGEPVVLLLGDRPMWRTLGEGVDDGPDVAQLEANLVALGYSTEAALGPNERWSAAATTAVKRWQQDLGVEATGTVDPSRVVFQPAAVRVADHAAAVGDHAGGPVLKVTGTTQSVHVDMPAKRQSIVHVGDAVKVVLPSGTTVDGTIASIGTVAQASQGGGDPTLPMEVSLADASGAAGLDQAPVTVKVTTTTATGALAVPVQALLALAEGGYAVELVDGAGTGTATRLVGVTLGASADGWVQVQGDVKAGDTVVTAK